MTTLYLVRHGETETNANKRFAGSYDAKLTQKGIIQAGLVAEYLRDVHFDAVYSSDLSRAMYTAKIIAEPHKLPVRVDVGLREISMGDWEGISLEKAQAGWPEIYRIWMEDQGHCRCPNGESIRQVQERFYDVIMRLTALHPAQTILAVSHGLAIKTLYCEIEKKPLEVFREQPYVSNASVTVMTRSNRMLSLKSYGEDHYLCDCVSNIFPEA